MGLPTASDTMDDDTLLLRTRSGAAPVEATSPLVPGDKVGRYLVRERIGKGGMGEVYEGFDPDLDRRIAIKLVHTRTAGDPQEQLNLVAEANALARLSHPNVVHVFDAGTHEGRVYVAMELVDGTTLQGWLRATAGHRRWRDVVACFIGAGRGLAAAHAAGIVHGDFKPSNVMIGADGRARVFDFGVARATADGPDLLTSHDGRSSGSHRLTLTTVRGTPGYMAPEIFREGLAHPAGDQFAFCVALYEALWERRPFAGERVDELRRNVQAGNLREPPPAQVPAALRRIVMRGLATDALARFPDMAALLAALERVLGRRRRVALAAVVLVPLALSGTSLLASAPQSPCGGADERTAAIWDDARREDVRAAFTSVGKAYADEASVRVVGQMDDYVAQWSDAYRSACTAAQGDAALPGRLDRTMACLSDAMLDFDATARLLAHPDSVVAREAAHVVARLPDPSTCGARSHDDVVQPDAPDTAPAVERIRHELAEIRALTRAAKFDEALRRARPLVAAASTFPGTSIDAETRLTLGLALDLRGDRAEAETAYLDAIEVAATARHTAVESECWANLVRVATVSAHYQDAHRYARQAEALLDRTGGEDRTRVALHMHVAGLLLAEAEYDAAIVEFERGLELGERVLAAGDGRIAGILNNLGAVHGSRGDHVRALEYFQRAHAIKAAALGPEHPDTATCMSNLAVTYERLGENERALELYGDVVEIRTRAFGPEHADVAVALHNLGSIESNLGHLDEALELYARALAIKRATLGAEHPSTAITESNIGDALILLHRPAEAIEHLERAAETLRNTQGADHPNLGFALFSLGEAELALGRPE
ncbi:MAG TPA: serine/threonine-protein kinase, partial [Nannocystaceae bacterium]|nr:serine/threonine-protein kinase [Nannocystaceae bacterium]